MKSILYILATVFRMVVIPAQFPDCEFSSGKSEIVRTAEAMQDYFNRQFAGDCTFIFEVSPTVTLSHTHDYYGANYTDRKDVLLHEAVREACDMSTTTDFATCDNDGDGFVDNVMILTAGKSETDGTGDDWIWPQRNFLRSNGGSMTIRGVRIDSYTVIPEGKLGLACHEMGHVLGLPDMYDTDSNSSGGQSKALWSTNLMDLGCTKGDGSTPPDFSAIEMNLLGLGSCKPLTSGHHTLRPINEDRTYLRMDTDTEGEYFLFECRKASGNDRNIGGSGMIVYHIDRSDRPAGYSDYYKVELNAYERWEKGQVNCRPDRQCAMIVPAKTDARASSDIFFPQKGISTLGSRANPAFRFWSGKSPAMALTGIVMNHDGSISFDAVEPISLTDITAWQDAATVCWMTDDDLYDLEGYEIEWTDGKSSGKMSGGKQLRSFTIEGLDPNTYYTFTLTATSGKKEGFQLTGEFTTKVTMEGTHPYIYLQSAVRKTDGRIVKGSRIPLRVFNAGKVDSVEWFMNGKAIDVDESGYFTIQEDGCLKARVNMTDGSTTILIKELVTI